MNIDSDFEYLNGFGNEHESEALSGALPRGQFNPQSHPMGLYSEQFSTTAFTAPRHQNRRTWMYKIRPSVTQGDYSPMHSGLIRSGPIEEVPVSPNLMRWDAFEFPEGENDFVDSLTTLAANGNLHVQTGSAVHMYLANKNMTDRFFYNADGELLIVPQQGAMLARTELGHLWVPPGEILVIPRGIKFQIQLTDGYGKRLHL